MLIFTSSKTRGNGGQKYYDPGKSMYDLAKTIDPTVTTEQSSYFPVVSETYLGQTQTEQFQSSTTTGKIWSSIYQDDGNNGRSVAKVPNANGTDTTIDGIARTVAPNANSEMPREYRHGNHFYGNIYNWYAAVAESGGYTTINTNVTDSICPIGWQLPNLLDGKSWRDLIIAQYGYIAADGNHNAAGSTKMRGLPLSLVYAGYYAHATGVLQNFWNGNGWNGNYWTNKAHTNNRVYANYLEYYSSDIYTTAMYPKSGGNSVRCVKRN